MKTFISILFFLAIVLSMNAQITDNENKKKIKKELYEYELADLVNLSIEELVSIAERLGISVDELLALSSTSSAKIKLSYRDAPNIMSIITKEQILALGVRDIKDLLELIPGYDFGYDIDAIVGVYNRGNWAHEGKVLLMIDGMEMNETLYSTTQFGLHYSISNIERIEIIRGGGSAIYGGSAELGIINIITQKADAMPLVSAHSKLGVMTEGFGFYSEEFATAF